MWSIFYANLRLKTLKQPAKEVITKMTTMFTRDFKSLNKVYSRKEFIYFMRGMTKFAWEKQYEMVRNSLISEKMLIYKLGDHDLSDTWNKKTGIMWKGKDLQGWEINELYTEAVLRFTKNDMIDMLK